jgi:beta-glucosidase
MGYIQKFEEEGNWRTPNIDTPNQELIAEAVEAAKKSDVAIIVAGNTRETESETKDRKTLTLPFGQDELIKAVAAVNPNTIVVIAAGAPNDLTVTSQNAQAVLYSWFNGSEGGNALADVLFGDVNPSGKLPFTIAHKLEDIGVHSLNAYPGENLKVEYTEGILVGYRWFDTKNIEPAYPFGFGLSYTNFELSKSKTDKNSYTATDKIQLTVSVENKGETKGKEVVQCYVHDLECSVMRPTKELKAFQKIEIEAGKTKNVSLTIDVEDLAFFDESSNSWLVEPGEFKLLIGTSSRNIAQEIIISVTDK